MDSGEAGSSAKGDMKDDAGPSQAQDRGDRGKAGPDGAKSAQDKADGAKSKDAAKADDKAGGDKSKDAKADSGKAKNDTAKSDDKSGSADKSAATGKSEGTAGAGAGPKLSGEQRTKVQSSFRGHKDKSVKNLNVSISVGTAIPRSVTLYAVPEDVVVIVPEYRRYKYFVYEEEVVIVDPDTYEIVEVIVLT
jgi:hypothetical protein